MSETDWARRFSPFVTSYPVDPGSRGGLGDWTLEEVESRLGVQAAGYGFFLRKFARESFADGLIRFLLPDGDPSLLDWNSASGWRQDWQLWRDRLVVFAYDWLGRQIGFDKRRLSQREPLIAILEPGTGELLEVPELFSTFMEKEVIEAADAALGSGFHQQWRAAGGRIPKPTQCVGYKVPLFLGGEDTIDNLEICDLAVYVSTCGQLDAQARGLSPRQR